jgi:hypothetical protein
MENANTPDVGTGPLTVAEAATFLTEPLRKQDTQTEDQGQERAETQATDEGAGEEVTAEATDDTGDEAPPAEAGAEEQSDAEGEGEGDDGPDMFTVKIDGKDVRIRRDELLKGYQRHADYSRKVQAVAEERKVVLAEAQTMRAEREEAHQLLNTLRQTMEAWKPKEPDWARLQQENPTEFLKQREIWRSYREQTEALEAEQVRLREKAATDQEAERRKVLLAERQALLEKIPEWKDAVKARSEKSAIIDYGRSVGFTEDELKGVFDHRILVLARKAMLYDKGIGSQKTIADRKVAQAPGKSLAPAATPRQTSKQAEIQRAKARLSRTGSIADAARLIELG